MLTSPTLHGHSSERSPPSPSQFGAMHSKPRAFPRIIFFTALIFTTSHVLFATPDILDDTPPPSIPRLLPRTTNWDLPQPNPSSACQLNSQVAFDPAGNQCVNLLYLTVEDHIYRLQNASLLYLVCVPPKTGSTNQLRLMHRINGNNYSSNGQVHINENQQLINIDKNEEEASALVLNDSIPKFQIVRNPLLRTLSAYLDKIQRKKNLSREEGPAAFRNWTYENLKPGMNWNTVDHHWRQQSFMCGGQRGDLNRYFHRIKFEDNQAYVDYIYNLVPTQYLDDGWGRPGDNISYRESLLGSNRASIGASEHFFEYIPDIQLFQHLEDVYRDDIVYLHYEKDVKELKDELRRRISEK